MEEIWKIYKETNSRSWGHRIYEVSNLGRVRVNGKIVEPSLSRGYLYVASSMVHIMVAKCFYPDKFQEGKRMEVHHIDFNRLNNAVTNLVVLTPGEHKQLHFDYDPKYEETRRKIGKLRKDKPRSEETKKKISEGNKDKIKGITWMTNDKEEMRVFPPLDKDMLIFGWRYGRLPSVVMKQKKTKKNKRKS